MKNSGIVCRINDLIAICKILNDFKEFNVDAMNFMISINFDKSKIIDLLSLAEGQRILSSRKVKNFYKKHTKTIHTINQYTYLPGFFRNYVSMQDTIEETQFYRFYQYAIKHKNDITRILGNLARIRKLGFIKIYFDETMDFTTGEYSIKPELGDNSQIVFLDNMTSINKKSEDQVWYKSDNSNYEITLGIDSSDISLFSGGKIAVNGLLFDPDRLPKSLTKENTFDKIRDLKKQDNVPTSLNDSIDAIMNALDIINNKFAESSDPEIKEMLFLTYYDIQDDLRKLEMINTLLEERAKSQPSQKPQL